VSQNAIFQPAKDIIMLTQDDMMAALDKATKTVIGEAHAFIYISRLYTDSPEYCVTSDSRRGDGDTLRFYSRGN
jgi:hypothetical protein